MKVFGGWLPFLGFRKYYSEELDDIDHSPDVTNYFKDQGKRIVGVELHTFEFEWIEYGLGYIYKTKFFVESE